MAITLSARTGPVTQAQTLSASGNGLDRKPPYYRQLSPSEAFEQIENAGGPEPRSSPSSVLVFPANRESRRQIN